MYSIGILTVQHKYCKILTLFDFQAVSTSLDDPCTVPYKQQTVPSPQRIDQRFPPFPKSRDLLVGVEQGDGNCRAKGMNCNTL